MPDPSPLQIDLARQVAELALRENWQPGEQMAEAPLARRLGVSRTPMRKALVILQKRGVLQFVPQRGFVIARPLTAEDTASGDSETRALTGELLRDRATGAVPREVSENFLLDRYSVSRGVIRKILLELAAQGLVQRQKGHGWAFIESIESPESLAESYRFRLAVECAAFDEPGYCADSRHLEMLVAAHERLLDGRAPRPTPEQWLSLNAEFHEALAQWSGNRFLHQAVRLQNALRLLQEANFYQNLSEGRLRQSLTDHLAILKAVRDGDLDIAKLLMRRHLGGTLDRISRASQKAIAL